MGVCVWGFFLSMQCNKCWTWIQTRILAYISTAPKWTLCKLNMDVMCCCCCWSQCTWINCVQLFLYGFPFAQFLFRYVNFTFLWSHTVFVHVYFACAWIRCRVRRQQMHKIKVFFFILSFNAFLFKRWSVYSLPFVRCAHSFYSQLYSIFFCISHSEWIFQKKGKIIL